MTSGVTTEAPAVIATSTSWDVKDITAFDGLSVDRPAPPVGPVPDGRQALIQHETPPPPARRHEDPAAVHRDGKRASCPAQAFTPPGGTA